MRVLRQVTSTATREDRLVGSAEGIWLIRAHANWGGGVTTTRRATSRCTSRSGRRRLLEIYVAAEDQGELNVLRWKDGKFEKSTVMPLNKGDITWNITDGKF
jgi:hypothetical protein